MRSWHGNSPPFGVWHTGGRRGLSLARIIRQLLFGNNEPGVFLDPTDISTLFQDTAGAVPVTTPGQTVARVNDKSGNGNHATQATAAARPTYGIVPETGRRNQILSSAAVDIQTSADVPRVDIETLPDFDLAVFRPTLGTVVSPTVGPIISPHFRSGSDQYLYWVVKPNDFQVLQTIRSASAMSGATIQWDFANGVATVSAGSPTNILFQDLGGGTFKCGFSVVHAVGADFGANVGYRIGPLSGTDGGKTFSVGGIQTEAGTAATPYQRVGTQFDVTEAGVPSLGYLSFDGVDDFLQTPTITPNTDKAQMFAGVRKLSDGAARTVMNHVVSNVSAGGFELLTSTGNNAIVAALGRSTLGATGQAGVNRAVNPIVSPASYVQAAEVDYAQPAGAEFSMRLDQVPLGQNLGLTQENTGNFGTGPIWVGARAGTSLFFNGHIHQLITRFGPNLPTADIEKAERYVASRTAGVTL